MKNDGIRKPLSPEEMEQMKKELTAEFDRQDDIKSAKSKMKREADPVRLLARVENLENQMVSVKLLLEKHSELNGRIIALLENQRILRT